MVLSIFIDLVMICLINDVGGETISINPIPIRESPPFLAKLLLGDEFDKTIGTIRAMLQDRPVFELLTIGHRNQDRSLIVLHIQPSRVSIWT